MLGFQRFFYPELTLEEINFLDQSIFAKAFRRELVPRDPNDEPAAVLLDRIRAEPSPPSTAQQKRPSNHRA